MQIRLHAAVSRIVDSLTQSSLATYGVKLFLWPDPHSPIPNEILDKNSHVYNQPLSLRFPVSHRYNYDLDSLIDTSAGTANLASTSMALIIPTGTGQAAWGQCCMLNWIV
jgi:hypothetical protein